MPDWNFWLSLISFVLALISVYLVYATVKQNEKILETSTRPYVCVYGEELIAPTPAFYIVIKNFGQSPAYMTKFKSDFDFSECYLIKKRDFLQDLNHCVIAPGQSRICLLDYKKISGPITFELSYSSGGKSYDETFCVDLRAAAAMISKRGSERTDDIDDQLKSISYTLQELVLRNL